MKKILLSAGTIYGNQSPPVNEQLPLTSYQGASKAAIEAFLRSLYK